jgi:beta-glucuronidase
MGATRTGNFESSIHNEDYYGAFDRRNLNHAGMIYSDNREAEGLDGMWHYACDQYDVGLRDNWHVTRELNERGEQLPYDFHPEEGEITRIPGCWNLIEPKYFYFEGCFWYSRTFIYKKARDGERVFLRVGAANYDAKVYLNGTFLGSHCGGSTPFFAELTGHLIANRRNLLLICVNNTRTSDRVPMKNTDWFNWGGLYRDVSLIRVPRTFIKDFKIHLVPDDRFDAIAFSAVISDADARGSMAISIPELGIQKEFPVEKGVCQGTFEARPEPWSPESPKLYAVHARYGEDGITDRVGFRQISVRGREVFLNGKEIYLAGISCHEDDVALGKCSDREDILRRFGHAKELGCNFLRLAHYPHHELAAKIADEVGLLLWEEIPVYWAIAFEKKSTYEDAENQLMELITRDFNRASVIIWSVGNENADTDDRLSFMASLAKKAKAVDPSRLVTAACLVNHAKNIIEDRLIEFLDIIGLNEYYGWYRPDFGELGALGKDSKPEKPVIISEFGAGARAGHHGTVHEKFTEEYMENIYKMQIATLRSLDYVKGMTPWILYDFTCPRRQNRFQAGYNRKGLIAEDKKTKKKAFFALQAFYLETRAAY